MHRFHTVYSTLDNAPSKPWLITGYILLMLFVCVCIALYFTIGRNLKVTLRGGGKVNPFLAVIPPVVVFALFYLSTEKLKIDVYQHDKDLLNSSNKELKVVEGPVRNYFPEKRDGHGNEEFTVQDTLFHYSHFEEGRSGYHQTFFYGGVIRPNLYVRITYYYDGDRNAILKLETE
ncbi:hypothetical protein [Mucilaginibacter flavus]|uniref:hypothetical protein n=1 Tax=Mucilaginibacter flavus TaxID=931504 RepID=UPI0025B33E4B|nr:hypothetical protein [Mucilaginibacter flavus]MDN3583897.1 hypothetical protein [Mucilaginibacter flavus]